MNIPLTLIITNPKQNNYTQLNFVCASLEECQNKLITNIKNKITMKIDYPDSLDEFTNIYWYNTNIINNPVFDYNIFYENQWTKPWSLDELYEDVLELIHTIDLQQSIFNKKNYENYDSSEENESEENELYKENESEE